MGTLTYTLSTEVILIYIPSYGDFDIHTVNTCHIDTCTVKYGTLTYTLSTEVILIHIPSNGDFDIHTVK